MQFIALLTPAVGSFVLVILAWLHQNQRLTDLRSDTNRQFDDTRRQFGDLRSDTNRQFAEFRSDTSRQFDDLRRQFGDLRFDANRQFDEVKQALATLTSDYHNFMVWSRSSKAGLRNSPNASSNSLCRRSIVTWSVQSCCPRSSSVHSLHCSEPPSRQAERPSTSSTSTVLMLGSRC